MQLIIIFFVKLLYLTGRAIRNLAVVLGAGTGGLSLASTLGIIGTFADSAGYSASRAVNVIMIIYFLPIKMKKQ